MPRVMTPEEARKKVCPFMSGPLSVQGGEGTQYTKCSNVECACWGWVDGERGEIGKFEVVDIAIEEEPIGDGWEKVGPTFNHNHHSKPPKQQWQRYEIKGPRRGQCEAMSPNIEVDCSS